MQHLFLPCTRYRDLVESRGRVPPERLRELRELNLNVSTEELLSAERAFTYTDLYAMLENGDTIAWLTPHAAILTTDGMLAGFWMRLNNSCRFRISTDDGKYIFALARSFEALSEIVDVVLRLLAVSAVHSVVLKRTNHRLGGALINAPTLAYLMEQCRSLKSLSLCELPLDENHCRVLGVYSRPGLEIKLCWCKLTSGGRSALAEVLGRNRGPTRLHYCEIDNVVLADGLRGNSRLKSVSLWISSNLEVGDREVREVVAIAGALRENKGLVELELRCYYSNMIDESWGAVCDSLKTHPTLEVLDLFAIGVPPPMDADVITSRTQALVDMMKVNTSIRTINVNPCFEEHDMYRGSIIPYLETNRFRPRVLAIQKTRPIVYRTQVVGRALLATRTDANKVWMLLSGNLEVAFPATTATIAAAANLPTSATATATSTANVTATAASSMSALTTTASGILPTAATAAATRASIPSTASASDAFASTPTAVAAAKAADIATPSDDQKRKARP
jgi:hypothetical protein